MQEEKRYNMEKMIIRRRRDLLGEAFDFQEERSVSLRSC